MKTITFDEKLWKLVPVEPITDMLIAGAQAKAQSMDGDDKAAIYKAMVAAAPQAPVVQQSLQPEYIKELAVRYLHCEDTYYTVENNGIMGWDEFAVALLKAPQPAPQAPAVQPLARDIAAAVLDHCYGHSAVSDDMIDRTAEVVQSKLAPAVQPLTDEQIRRMWVRYAPEIGAPLMLARTIEAAHGIAQEAGSCKENAENCTRQDGHVQKTAEIKHEGEQ